MSIIDAVRFRFVQKEVGRLGKSISRKERDGMNAKKEADLLKQYKAEYEQTKLELDKQIKKTKHLNI